jgi:DNA polymerase-3 subunit epsilon
VALDFETTGLEPSRDSVVSFGLIPVTGGRIDLSAAVYEEVAPDSPLSARSITVHELRPQDLASAPPFEAVRESLRRGLDNRWILAWVADVETGFLARAFGGLPLTWRRRTIDVWRLAVFLDQMEGRDPGPGERTLAAAAAYWGVPVEQAHHALDDALMTAELFLVLATKLAARGNPDIRGLRRVARRAGRSPSPTPSSRRRAR